MSKKPNVLLIISDQWAKRTADGSGNNKNGVVTNGIDRIAREGIRFENNYSCFPLCCPARSSMFTGVMPHTNNIIDNQEIFHIVDGKIPTRDDLATLGEEFKKAGYNTAYFGKEHAGDYGYKGIDDCGSFKFAEGGRTADGSVFDQIFTRDAINYLNRDHEKPFYMTLSLINPHDMCRAFGGVFQDIFISDAIHFCYNDDETYLRGQKRPELPSNFENKVIDGMLEIGDNIYRGLDTYSIDDWKRNVATYNLLVEKTDWYIEDVLNTLDKRGLTEDTIVIFTTDHGDMMGSHKIIAKTNFYEESANTHMLVRYPALIKPNQVNETAITNTIDMMPTILDLCGLEIPETCKGKSFKSECLGEDSGEFLETYCENRFSRMVRFENYKYIISSQDREYNILFDLEKDPDEAINVYNTKGYEEISAKLREKLVSWIEKEGIGFSFPKTLDKLKK